MLKRMAVPVGPPTDVVGGGRFHVGGWWEDVSGGGES